MFVCINCSLSMPTLSIHIICIIYNIYIFIVQLREIWMACFCIRKPKLLSCAPLGNDWSLSCVIAKTNEGRNSSQELLVSLSLASSIRCVGTVPPPISSSIVFSEILDRPDQQLRQLL